MLQCGFFRRKEHPSGISDRGCKEAVSETDDPTDEGYITERKRDFQTPRDRRIDTRLSYRTKAGGSVEGAVCMVCETSGMERGDWEAFGCGIYGKAAVQNQRNHGKITLWGAERYQRYPSGAVFCLCIFTFYDLWALSERTGRVSVPGVGFREPFPSRNRVLFEKACRARNLLDGNRGGKAAAADR